MWKPARNFAEPSSAFAVPLAAIADTEEILPNCLFVCQVVPNPDGIGVEQRTAFLLDALKEIYDVDVLLINRFWDKKKSKIKDIGKLSEDITIFNMEEWIQTSDMIPKIPWRIGRWIDYLRFGSATSPYFSQKSYVGLSKIIKCKVYDAIFSCRLSCAKLILDLKRKNLVHSERCYADFDDVQSTIYLREIRKESKLDKKIYDRILINRTKKCESNIIENFDAISVCSDKDVDDLRAYTGRKNIYKVPNISRDIVCDDNLSSGKSLFFVGALSYQPNVQGIRKFIDLSWPLIRAAHPDAEMVVAGRNPDDDLRKFLACNAVTLHENPPVIDGFYQRASVVICPILIGGGTRIKILEAMAAERPVVSTSIGAEGIEYQDGRNIVIADDFHDMAQSVVALLNDEQARRSIALGGKELHRRKYSKATATAAVKAMVSSMPDFQ